MLKIAQETVFGDKESISVFSVSAHTAAEWNIWDSRVKILSDTSYRKHSEINQWARTNSEWQ